MVEIESVERRVEMAVKGGGLPEAGTGVGVGAEVGAEFGRFGGSQS